MRVRSVKGVSNLLALLIIIAIVVGTAIAVALMVSGMTQRLQPSGAAVTIQGLRLQDIRNNKLMVDASIYVTGGETVRCDSIEVWWDGVSKGSATINTGWLQPGSITTIQAVISCSADPPDYQFVRVVIRCWTNSGTEIRGSGSAKVEPP